MPDTAVPVNLRISRDNAGLGALGNWADAVIQGLALEKRAAYAFRLCLEEAVMNLVMHGQPAADHDRDGIDSDGVDLSADLAEGSCVLVIRDRCLPFDPTGPAPTAPVVSLESDQVGGAGLHLLRHFATEVGYHAERGGNRLVIRIARGEPL